jgi:dihydrodipicolinate synthase/N-acetylneuraminate lyase
MTECVNKTGGESRRPRPVEGPIFAAPTPFDSRGSICLSAYRDFLEFLSACGVEALVVNGTTGEFPSLDRQERQSLYDAARQHFRGIVVANISSANAREANALAKYSIEADALLILPPYYYAGVADLGLIDFFRQALDGVITPTFLYNFPRHVKISLTPTLVESVIAACPTIVGVKDSSGDVDIARAFKNLAGVRQVFVGKDAKALAALDSGLDGSITGAGNPFPEFLVGLRRAWAAGDTLLAQRLQQEFDLWNDFRAGFKADEPALVKATLAKRLPGYPIHVRPPLRALDAGGDVALERMIARLTRTGRLVA